LRLGWSVVATETDVGSNVRAREKGQGKGKEMGGQNIGWKKKKFAPLSRLGGEESEIKGAKRRHGCKPGMECPGAEK